MKNPNKNVTDHWTRWFQVLNTWLHTIVKGLTDSKFVNYIQTTRNVQKRYHILLRETRKSLLKSEPSQTSIVSLQNQLEQIKIIRELYKRSVQRLYDIALLILLGIIGSYLLLKLRPQPTVTVLLGIRSNSVDLRGIPPSWSMHGADESDQILHTNKAISVSNVDWIEHNKSSSATTDTKRFKLNSIDADRRPSQLSLDDISFKGGDAHLSIETKNNVLNLAVATDGPPITIQGTLCKNGCLGELILGQIHSKLDTSVALNFGAEAVGNKRLELAFSSMLGSNGATSEDVPHASWENIPIRDTIIFARPSSDTTELSTIESGWIYILQTKDTIRMGKHDALKIHLAGSAVASVTISKKNSVSSSDPNIDLFTEVRCEVSELAISQGEFKQGLMPRQIEVMAEQKDKSLLFAIIGLLATLFVPLIFRNRL